MQHQTNKLINLEDDSPMSFLQKTSDNVRQWFQKEPFNKVESPCKFAKKNKIRCFRSRKLRNGNLRLSLLTQEGLEIFCYAKNFSKAYTQLVEKFYVHIKH